MKAYIMTDLECVAAVVSLPEYCLRGPRNKYGRTEGGSHHALAKELATREVNAAVAGLVAAGVADILVCDGHGHGGLEPALLDAPARMLTGLGQPQPRGLDGSFDLALMVGQHAKAGTDGGHLCHSYSFFREKTLLNGAHHAEIACFAILCSYLDVPLAMISGDRAACAEARELIPSIVTVPVIEGERCGSTMGLGVQEAIDLNVPATHLNIHDARERIRDGAMAAVAARTGVERFFIEGPYRYERVNRRDDAGRVAVAVNESDDFLDLMSQKPEYRLVEEA